MIPEWLRSLHIPGNYIGFRQLCRAVELCLQNEDALFNVYRDIYGVIAQETGVTVKAVEKNIRTVITAAWLRGCKTRLSEVAGYPIDIKPSASEFLDIVTSYLRHLSAEEVRV